MKYIFHYIHPPSTCLLPSLQHTSHISYFSHSLHFPQNTCLWSSFLFLLMLENNLSIFLVYWNFSSNLFPSQIDSPIYDIFHSQFFHKIFAFKAFPMSVSFFADYKSKTCSLKSGIVENLENSKEYKGKN